MRYPAEHKEQSRARIVESARELFRHRGFDAVSIDEVMNRAGLTRGAFYAHFESKNDLIGETLEIEAGLVKELLRAATTPEPTATALQALSHYLDPEERSNIASGCPLVAHPADAVRGDEIRRRGYTARLNSLVDSLTGVLGGNEKRDTAILVSVLAVGAGLLSAASEDIDLANQIESVSLSEIATLLTRES